MLGNLTGGRAAASASASTSTCTSTTTSLLADIPIRLRNVTGFQNRINDVVYCPPLIRHGDEAPTVVYFGGDVQDYTENMEQSRDSKSYVKYNLDATATLLRNSFPRAHIAVIRPARMEFKTFSCFDNFVRGNNAGVPDHTPMHHSLQHLEKLLHSVSQRLLGLSAAPTAVSADQEQEHAQVVNGKNNGILTDDDTAADEEEEEEAAAVEETVISVAGQDAHDAQDMDIDILQVQETVTVDTNGSTIVYTDKEEEEEDDEVLIDTIEPAETTTSITPHSVGQPLTVDEVTQSDDDDQMQSVPELTASCSAGSDLLWWRDNLNLDKCKLTLIGFSKGCVVLNQFIYEFHYLKTLTPDDFTMIRLLSRIKEMYWLDGGHGGAKNTWITSRSLLETLTRLSIQIHVHVTPYQVQDERRPWIRREEKTFVELLRRLGAPMQRCLHFDTSVANLFTHFEVLQVFRQPCPPQSAAHISPTRDGDDEK